MIIKPKNYLQNFLYATVAYKFTCAVITVCSHPSWQKKFFFLQNLTRFLQLEKIWQKLYKKFSSCIMSGCSGFLARFLEKNVLYQKNFARNAFVCSEDKLICCEELTMILNFRFTLKVLGIGTFCARSIMLFKQTAGFLVSAVKIVPETCWLLLGDSWIRSRPWWRLFEKIQNILCSKSEYT